MIRLHRLKRFADEHNIPFREMYVDWRRIAISKMLVLEEEARDLVAMAEQETDGINAEVYSWWAIGLMIEKQKLKEEMKRMDETLNPQNQPKKDAITDEMIERARDYPVTQLIDFQRGKVACPFHADKNPSAYFGNKTNRLICPVCNETWDAISILVKRDGMTFIDAVKTLA